MFKNKTKEILLLSLFILLPSTGIIEVLQISPPPTLPKQIAAGDTLLIFNTYFEATPDYVSIGQIEMSQTAKARFAGIGLNTSERLAINGLYLQKKHYWFQHPILIKKQKLRPATRLRLPAQVWNQEEAQTEEQKKRDRQIQREILNRSEGKIIQSCWQPPLRSVIVSKFGSPRTLPNGRTYHHGGVDYRARKGTPIKAAGPGIVVFDGQTLAGGKTVVVHHGEALYSRYLHLDQHLIKAQDQVNKNTLIGLAGATGRVEASHLHFEVIWKGIYIDPIGFLRAWQQICDPV